MNELQLTMITGTFVEPSKLTTGEYLRYGSLATVAGSGCLPPAQDRGVLRQE